MKHHLITKRNPRMTQTLVSILVNYLPEPKQSLLHPKTNFDDILSQYFDPFTTLTSRPTKDVPSKSALSTPKNSNTPRRKSNDLRIQLGILSQKDEQLRKNRAKEYICQVKTPGNRFHEELKSITYNSNIECRLAKTKFLKKRSI